ncbi:MAG: Mut7-C RNAse domain-containing protein [Halolamina sp.]
MSDDGSDGASDLEANGADEGDGRERFCCDAMCGKLATYLRMCGHDVAYALDRGVEADDELAALARTEDRRLLTRDRELARRLGAAAVELTERSVEGQLRELAAAGVDLTPADRPRYCGVCNGLVRRVEAGSEPDHAPDDVAVWRCVDCGQAFWRGSHWEDVVETLVRVRDTDDQDEEEK